MYCSAQIKSLKSLRKRVQQLTKRRRTEEQPSRPVGQVG